MKVSTCQVVACGCQVRRRRGVRRQAVGDGPVFKGEIRTIQKGTTLSIFRMSFSGMSTSKRIGVALSSLALLLGAMSIVAFGRSAQAKIAAAAVLNVTAVNPSQDGYLTVWPVGMG